MVSLLKNNEGTESSQMLFWCLTADRGLGFAGWAIIRCSFASIGGGAGHWVIGLGGLHTFLVFPNLLRS